MSEGVISIYKILQTHYSNINGQNPDVNYRPAEKQKKGAAKVIALALCCSLVGGAAGAGATVFASNTINDNRIENIENSESPAESSTLLEGQRGSTVLNVSQINTETEMTSSEIYAANVNSTVGITTSVTTNYFGYQTTAAAAGSGFIITSDGYIVTNYHVIEGANEIKVTTYDNKTYEATLIGYDESNDIAVLKIDEKDLTPVILGDSDQMNVGDNVVAIGNPLGELTFSLTAGTVSALNRKITISNTAMNLIQTDCAINSGNSGGALFNSHGEVIGITNAKYSGNTTGASIDNIGFAIPINSVRNIIKSIIEKGYIEKPYIGITVYNMASDYQNNNQAGVTIHSVEDDSPAGKAGLKADDVITEVNGTGLNNFDELKTIISKCSEGDKLTLTISRNGKTMEIEVSVGISRQTTTPEEKTVEQSDKGQGNFEFPSELPSGFPSDLPSDLPSDWSSELPSDWSTDLPSDFPQNNSGEYSKPENNNGKRP